MEDVSEGFKSLKQGKAADLGNHTAEHFIYADKSLIVLLTLLINCMLIHGYAPSKFMETVLIPIVKDKKESVTDSDNYRPIALTTVFSKIFEIIVLNKYGHLLSTQSNQFGFKKGHSTEMCVFVLKSIIEYYTSLSSPVFICFLDASKAFDRIEHCKLFDKLLERKVPTIIVRFLCVWYSTQKFSVRWGESMSFAFSVSNGVRQGGVLSPVLFNVYIDDLSKFLASRTYGCRLNDISINHLVYADDMVLIAPSISALRKLIKSCENYAHVHSILYNTKKTKFMCVTPKQYKNVIFPSVYLYRKNIVTVDSEKYLGYMFSNDSNDIKDINRQLRCLYLRGNTIIRNFKHCTNDVKTYVYD